jgi:2-polyprenyl-3-methyl-5-hydroxy-6-metoxy-1,4-benzoquinol methylase
MAQEEKTLSNSSNIDHAEVNRKAFTLQATTYANASVITDEGRLQRLAKFVAPRASDRILEIACGPGLVAMTLAPLCQEVLAFDLTEAPLKIAKENANKRGITNAKFEQASVYEIPLADGIMDRAACRYAFHHFEFPLRALREMVRCCIPGGTVVIEDLYSSETPARAAYHDKCEILRDPSHRRALPLSEMLGLFALAGLEIQHVSTATIQQNGEDWLRTGFSSAEEVVAAREMLERDAVEGLSPMQPYRDENGTLYFDHRTVIVVGRKL